MVFIGRLKTDIKRKLYKFVGLLAIIFAITAFIVNAVFAVAGLNVPVEIIWDDDDNAGSTRPAQVILHLRKTGDTQDTATATVTSANQVPGNPNKWTYTFNVSNYNSSDSYEVYQEVVGGYTNNGPSVVTITNSPSASSITAMPASELSRTGDHYIGDIDFVLSKYGGNYYLFTRTSSKYVDPELANLISNLELHLGHSITIAGYVAKNTGTQVGGNARISYMNLGKDNVNLRILAAQEEVYYGTLSSSTSASAVITNTVQSGYSVSYQFTGSVLPPNASSLLPATSSYVAGDTVTVAQNPTASGYRFLGWKINGSDAGTSFTMPNSDVTITGSWEQFNGYFAPTISKQVTNPQNVYRFGDTVEFLVTVSNSESYPITNVEVTEDLAGARFLAATGYTVSNSGDVATIATIPANGTVVLYAEYDITDDVTQTGRTNTAEITAASASNYYFLDPNQNYTASATFDTQSWQDVPVLTGVDISPRTTLLYYFLLVIGAGGIVGGVVVNQKNKEREK